MAQSKQKTGKAPATPLVEARIDHLLSGEGKTKAFASATIAGAYAIHGLRVIESEKGLFVSMPQESYTKNGEKKYTDTFHAITAEARTELIDAVQSAYEQALAQQQSQEETEETQEAEETQEQGMEMSM